MKYYKEVNKSRKDEYRNGKKTNNYGAELIIENKRYYINQYIC